MFNGSERQSSSNNGNQSQNSKRDPFAVAIEEFLLAFLADKRIPVRQRYSTFTVAWYLTTLANRGFFKKHGLLEAWPGLQTMARKLGMTKHTVIEAIRILREYEYAGVAWGKAGRGTSNRYYLVIPNSAASALLKEAGNSAASAPFHGDLEKVQPASEIVHSGGEKVHSQHLNSAASAPLEVQPVHQNLLNEPLEGTAEEPPEGTEGSPYIEIEGSSASLRTPESPSSIPIADPSKGQIPTTSQDPSASETLAGEKVAARGKGNIVDCYRIVIECSGCGDTASPHMIPVAHCEVIAKGVRQLECEYCSSKLRLGIEDRLDYPKSQIVAERAERAARRAERDRRNMAQVKRGSELFNEHQGEVRHLRTVQIEETRETPLDLHEDPDDDYCQDDDEPDGLDTVG